MRRFRIITLTCVCVFLLSVFSASATTRYDVANTFYPVGCYYETSDANFDPAEQWGGTWVLETEGQVHVSGGSTYVVFNADTNGGAGTTDGGRTDEIIPAHTHSVPSLGGSTNSTGAHTHAFGYRDRFVKGSTYKQTVGYSKREDGTLATSSAGAHTHTFTAPATTTGASGSANTNMQPYINIYRWHRTA